MGHGDAGARSARFASVVLDVDSTLSGIEGIEWLAALRGDEVRDRIAALTTAAMAGEIALDAIYADRLDAIRPTRDELAALGATYITERAEGAEQAIAALTSAGVRVVLVSGGIRDAILPLAALLGIETADVHAVSVRCEAGGAYADFDRASPLATQGGKPLLVRALKLQPPVLAVGDGSTDLAIRTAGACDVFAAYTGFVERASVVEGADLSVGSFAKLLEIALP